MSEKKRQNCGCVAKINASLFERKARLVGTMILLPGQVPRAHVEIESIEYTASGRAKTLRWHLAATFCPFCGKRYAG